MVRWSRSLAATYSQAFGGTGTACPPLETSWLRTASADPYSLAAEPTFSRNVILIHTLHHPQELTRKARITVWKPHRHVLFYLYKAFSSVAHAEACQTPKETWHDDYDNGYVRGTMSSARDVSQVLPAP